MMLLAALRAASRRIFHNTISRRMNAVSPSKNVHRPESHLVRRTSHVNIQVSRRQFTHDQRSNYRGLSVLIGIGAVYMGSTFFSWKKQEEKSKKEEDEHHKSADADLADTAANTASTVDQNPSNSALNPQVSDTSKPSIDLHNIESYQHPIVFPPYMPPSIVHDGPVRVCIDMDTYIRTKPIDEESCFDWWTYNGGSPGPIIRLRLGDVLEVHFTNKDQTGMQHNIDFHAVEGPGGGSSLLTVDQGQKKIALFKPLRAGLFLYHCAMAPAPVHLAQGMYGCVLVEPEGGLQPPAQREYCIVQAELYTSERIDEKEPVVYIGPDEEENREKIENELKGLSRLDMDVEAGILEKATYVLFNGIKGAEGYNFPEHTDTSIDLAKDALLAKPGDNIRIFFVNAGPNLVSSFHVIGGCWDRVWREADLVSAPAQAVQTTLVPAGGCAVVDFQPHVPGTYTIVDHSLFRIEKGAVKFIHVKGDPLSRPDLYASGSGHGLKNCDACKLHPK